MKWTAMGQRHRYEGFQLYVSKKKNVLICTDKAWSGQSTKCVAAKPKNERSEGSKVLTQNHWSVLISSDRPLLDELFACAFDIEDSPLCVSVQSTLD